MCKSDSESSPRAGGSAPLAETDLGGAFTRQYVYFAGRMIGYLDAANSRYYMLADPLGSTRVMVNNTGVVKEDSDFTPYGNERVVTDLLANTRKFTGYERDPESGNDQAIFRYYNPRWGRFMSADPLSGDLGDPQSLNRFAYVMNNPVNAVDPFGLETCVQNAQPGGCVDVVANAPSPLGSNGSWFWLFAASGPGFGDFLRMIMGIPPSSSNSSSSNTSPPPDPPKPPPAKPAPTLANNAKKVVGCFLKGAAVGAVGAVAVGALAVGAVAVGAPVAVVTGVLGAAALVGTAIVASDVVSNGLNGNYPALAYDFGSFAGGIVAGSAAGGRVANGIRAPASQGLNWRTEWALRYKSGLGTVTQWLGTGPTGASAAGATAATGAGVSAAVSGGC